MRDYLATIPRQEQEAPASIIAFANEQVAGNQAAQAEVTREDDAPGFLDWIDFDGIGGDVDVSSPVHEPAAPLTNDERGTDHLDLLAAPTTFAHQGEGDAFGTTSTGVSVASTTTDRNPLLGDAASREAATFDLANGNARFDRSYRVRGADGDQGAWGTGAFVQVGKEGQVVAGAGAKAGSIGGSAQAMVDVGSDGQVQAVGAGASIEGAGMSASVHGAIELGTVQVDGRAVSRKVGSNTNAALSWGPVGVDGGAAWSYGETVTFSDKEQAETYARECAEGQHARVADLSARDIQALPEGARAEYVWQASLNAGGTVVIKPEGHAEASQKVTIERGSSDVIRLNVEQTGLAGVGVGADNGFIGTEGRHDLLAEGTTTYEVDLADPDQVAAFERFQSTGDRSGLKLVSSEVLSGSRTTSSAHGFGMEVTESNERLSGERRDANGITDVDRGGYAVDGQGWDFGSLMNTAARWSGNALEMLARRPQSETEAKRKANQKDSAEAKDARPYGGSTNGKHAGRLDVLTNRDDGTTLAAGEQTVDFDDQREIARFMHDQLDPQVDRADVNPNLLPPHAKSDHIWKLETRVTPDGIQNIGDLLDAGGPFPCESAPAIHAWVEARDTYSGSERAPADLRGVVADVATQGEDALECVGAIAGEGNVERYLSRDGDDTFLSFEEHDRLQARVNRLVDGALRGVPEDITSMQKLKSELEARLARLTDGPHTELPPELARKEWVRLKAQLRIMEGV